jgi:chemotaxis signal transduction protein
MAESRPPDPASNGYQPPSDDALRLTLATFATANAQAEMAPRDYLALLAATQETIDLPAADEIGCVFFTCGDQRWGARLDDIQRIVPQLATPPVAIPAAPPWAAGVVRVEAEFVTLIDTARFLYDVPSFPARHQRHHGILVIIERDALLGLFVTKISLATTVKAGDIHESAACLEDDPPYLLARYAPAEAANPQAEGARGFLDVRAVAAACLNILDGEEEADA